MGAPPTPVGTPLPATPAEYGKVTRMLGNGRLEAYCFDGKTRLCHIRGKMRKKVRACVRARMRVRRACAHACAACVRGVRV